jgi:hypothetical protein
VIKLKSRFLAFSKFHSSVFFLRHAEKKMSKSKTDQANSDTIKAELGADAGTTTATAVATGDATTKSQDDVKASKSCPYYHNIVIRGGTFIELANLVNTAISVCNATVQGSASYMFDDMRRAWVIYQTVIFPSKADFDKFMST